MFWDIFFVYCNIDIDNVGVLISLLAGNEIQEHSLSSLNKT